MVLTNIRDDKDKNKHVLYID